MNQAVIFIDLENVRIRAGKLKPPIDIFKTDFFVKLKGIVEHEDCKIIDIYAYDNYENKYFMDNCILSNFSAQGINIRHTLSTNGFKNSADLEMSLDAFEIALKSDAQTFVILSSDKDMFPLIKKLKMNLKEVILFGYTFNTSTYVIKYVDKFIPMESVLGYAYDKDHIIKQDIIIAVRRIHDLYDWANGKLGRDYCLEKVRQTLFESSEYTEQIFEKLEKNNIIEECEYTYKATKHTGIKFISSDISNSILKGEIPNFS